MNPLQALAVEAQKLVQLRGSVDHAALPWIDACIVAGEDNYLVKDL